MVGGLHAPGDCRVSAVFIPVRVRGSADVPERRRGSSLASAPDFYAELLGRSLPESVGTSAASWPYPWGRTGKGRAPSHVRTNAGKLPAVFRRSATGGPLASG